jgi:hypothetical protein
MRSFVLKSCVLIAVNTVIFPAEALADCQPPSNQDEAFRANLEALSATVDNATFDVSLLAAPKS